MSKRTKRFLFYTALIIFLILGFFSILYAQGYKYSFKENKFFLTGAIALKANTRARVLINEENEGETSFFGNSFSIDRLLPGNHKVTVIKDGYAVWQKIASVEEGFVTDFPNVLLLPESGPEEEELFAEVELLFKNLELFPVSKVAGESKSKQDKELNNKEALAEDDSPFFLDLSSSQLFKQTDSGPEEIALGVKGFRLSENKNKLAWWNSNEIWMLWLNDQNYQPFRKKGDKELITRFQLTIQNGSWFRDEDHIILELEKKDSKNRPYSIYRIIETDKRGGINIVEL